MLYEVITKMNKHANPTHVIVKSGISPVLAPALANNATDDNNNVIKTFNIVSPYRITSYNVCYTKLLRIVAGGFDDMS